MVADKVERIAINKITLNARERWGWAGFLVPDADCRFEINGAVSSIWELSLARLWCSFLSL